MTPAPSIDAVSGLVEELRAAEPAWWAAWGERGPGSVDGPRVTVSHYHQMMVLVERAHSLGTSAADALEAQARELAEARRERDIANDAREAHAKCVTALIATAQSRIAALEDAVRVKDEALREAIEFADQDAQALTPAGIAMVERWSAAVSTAEKLCPHAPTYDAGLCCGHPDDCTFVSPPRTALSNGEPHDR